MALHLDCSSPGHKLERLRLSVIQIISKISYLINMFFNIGTLHPNHTLHALRPRRFKSWVLGKQLVEL